MVDDSGLSAVEVTFRDRGLPAVTPEDAMIRLGSFGSTVPGLDSNRPFRPVTSQNGGGYTGVEAGRDQVVSRDTGVRSASGGEVDCRSGFVGDVSEVPSGSQSEPLHSSTEGVGSAGRRSQGSDVVVGSGAGRESDVVPAGSIDGVSSGACYGEEGSAVGRYRVAASQYFAACGDDDDGVGDLSSKAYRAQGSVMYSYHAGSELRFGTLNAMGKLTGESPVRCFLAVVYVQ